MHRAGGFHLAIVFERLAATMRNATLSLLLAAALLAGCGGSSKKEETSNKEAFQPPASVLLDSQIAASNARSVHVAGNIVSGGTPIKLDVSMARKNDAEGSMSTNKLSFNLVRVGDTLYIQGSDAFYKHFAGAAVAQLLHGRWMKASTTTGQLKSLAPLTNIDALFNAIRSNHGGLANKGTTTYQGQKVVEIRDSSDGSRLYVAATGKPLPVAIVGGKKGDSGSIRFSDWNAPVSISAPKNALDISQLGVGG
jgi:hypothetical protein